MKHNKSILKKTTVVDFKQDAAFFVDRGMRFLNRYDYEKALRSFRRAIELAPTSAECHCHLASALAEAGQFEASNDVLYEVIEKWDTSMTEVYFYMANNYANLEDFQMAEELAIRYLQEDSTGPYREEAEELLDYIYFELDMPPRHFLPSDKEDVYSKHERARRSLEEGRFLEALDILKEIVEADPDFLPAWNNLSLAYYYAGDFQKAMDTIEQTLDMENGNLHALCNLAVLLSHHNEAGELLTLMDMLKKVVPFHPENTYKLATTMGVLGQHDEAYFHYQRMLRSGQPQEACTYHYAAISAYLSERKDQALRWWQKAKQMDPEAGIADQYIQMVKNEREGETIKPIPYQYNPPQNDVSWEQASFTGVQDFKSDPMIRASLLWALQHGRDEVKFAVLQTLSLIGDDEAETAVRQFYYQTDNQQLQKLALLALADMGAAMPAEAPDHNEYPIAEVHLEDSVEEAIRHFLLEDGQKEAGDWCLRFWSHYHEHAQNHVQVRKAVAWVAALEYVYGTVKQEKKSQAYLAKKYGISVTTVAKCVKVLSTLDFK
ncbi:lipopolysaccharide assembly protein LapB [uncultured Brevibacillus sp.]|uniref:tetratricopeptide repeat protein n=1 Tax=uncultured Brevibacillus sp. TaxID=169970 RepID=UPI0025978238|nr:tetratricopeptide repeat protein [uncultured Brevibacillus sp.]